MRELPAVCVFIECYYPQLGGTTTHARLLARDLSERGMPHFVITRQLTSDTPKQDQVDGLRVVRVRPTGEGSIKKWGMLLYSLPVLFRNRRDFDVIYVPGFRVIGMLAVVFAWLFRKKCVLRGVSCGEMSGAFFDDTAAKLPIGLRQLFRCFVKLRNVILRRADAIVAISQDLEDELRQSGVSDSRVVRIPNAVDMGVYYPAEAGGREALRRKLGLPQDGIVVVYTGRLVRYKGLVPLLEAWVGVLKVQGSQPLHLVLVGSGSNDIHNCEEELKVFADEHDLSDSVTFTGDVDGVAPYLQAADIFAFPTENEAFGISLIEAMACGLPSVSTDVGGVKDIVRHESNALVFDAGDADALAEALGRLIESEDLRRELGAGALETVRQKFSTEKISAQYFELFALL
jgi:glycosyltransferase involved in cell wall biosynthesis